MLHYQDGYAAPDPVRDRQHGVLGCEHQTVGRRIAGWRGVVGRTHSQKTTDGPTTYDDVYSGEKYDGRVAAALGDWQHAGYNDQAWTKPIQMLAPGSCTSPNPAPCHGFLPDSGPAPTGYRPAALRAQEHQPVYVYEVLHPLSVVETFPGSHVYIFDMGNDRRRYRGKSLESGPWDPHHRLLLRG